MFWSSAIFTFFTFTLQSKLFKFHFHCRPRTNCKIDQYPFEIPSVLFNQAHWWILLLFSELGVVFAARKLGLVISFDITNATTLRWRRSFHATLAPKNTIWEQDWKITSKENIKTSSLPFPSFVISVRRLLKQKVECLNTRPTCTEWPGHPCRVPSVRKPSKRSLLLWNTHQHFIGSLSATSVPKKLGSRRSLKEHKKRKHVNVEPVQVVGVAQGENTI